LDATSAAGTVRVRSQDLAHVPSIIVASEPMTESQGWTLMKPGELLHVDRHPGTTRRVELPDPPRHQLRLHDLEPHAAASQRSRAAGPPGAVERPTAAGDSWRRVSAQAPVREDGPRPGAVGISTDRRRRRRLPSRAAIPRQGTTMMQLRTWRMLGAVAPLAL